MTTVARTRAELTAAREAMTGRVAVVMTMGALHEGHRHLMDVASESADDVIVTIFVNPLQFGANEDLDRYPRDFDGDRAICEAAGVSVVFAPETAEMYLAGEPTVRVSSGALGQRLEGASRPGHFDGVLTVVVKLLHLCRPDAAIFGEKDAQQLELIRRMVRDLDVPVAVIGVPTLRAPCGLALSSRNRYLERGQRTAATALSRALRAGAAEASNGPDAVLKAASAVIEAEPGATVDYVTVVDESTWEPADRRTTVARLLLAARVGRARLIDNVVLNLGTR